MAQASSIEWTEATWNPVTGCTKISPGCKHCYAERMAKRLQAMGQERYRNGFRITLQPDPLEEPLRWKRPRMIFVNSMSDLFHKQVPLEYIRRVFSVMRDAHWHTFQILTKRGDRLQADAHRIDWPANVWMGVSVESDKYLHRVEQLRTVPAMVRFLSIEPLLGPIPDLSLTGIGWVIVGGESGPGARPMNPSWVRTIRDRCLEERVPFFFKQWGGVWKSRQGRELDGRTWDEMPRRVRPATQRARNLCNSSPYRATGL
jgi:protein gp37